MARNWRIFEETLPHEKNEIYVSMNHAGEVTLNRHTLEILGQPEAIFMMHEPETYSIGLRKTGRLMPNAFKGKPKSDCGGASIRAKLFCDKHEIKYKGTVRFLDAQLEDDTLVLNLLKTMTVTRKQNPAGRKRC